jgi:hypothetical protein
MDGRAGDGRQTAATSDNGNKRTAQRKPEQADTGTMENAESKNYRALRPLIQNYLIPKRTLKKAGLFFQRDKFKGNIMHAAGTKGNGLGAALNGKVLNFLGMAPVKGVGNL